MSRLAASLAHNLARLVAFSGRDSRALFWPYVLLLLALAVVADLAFVVPPLIAMVGRFRDYLVNSPDPFPEDGSGAAPWPPELIPDFSGAMLPLAIVNLLLVALTAAAAVRRLHDSDRSGLWSLLPLPSIAIGHAHGAEGYATMLGFAMPGMVAPLLALNGLAWWGTMILLIVFLAAPGTAGPNRYGPPSESR